MLGPDLGGVAVIVRMPGAGIVDGDVGGRDKAGMQHSRILGNKAVQSLCQKSNHLALGDVDADIVQQRRQPRHRHLSLRVQHQAKPPEVWAVAADDPWRQWCQHHLAIRQDPAFAPVMHELSCDNQLSHMAAFVALEAPAGRNIDVQDLLAAHPL
ncbi:hypothetical protein [Ensifer sp. ENS12]|uniref:hypothetical protein n=1 Tax=Ensifer sp. ENS12 TaxID=2854774 RepID=UPI0021078EF7|nr:hypothetical protein [Ensifer sp. ENS12]